MGSTVKKDYRNSAILICIGTYNKYIIIRKSISIKISTGYIDTLLGGKLAFNTHIITLFIIMHNVAIFLFYKHNVDFAIIL